MKETPEAYDEKRTTDRLLREQLVLSS